MRKAKHYYLVGRELSRRELSMFGIGTKEREKEWATFEAEALPLIADVFRVANYLARDRETAEDLKSFRRYARQFVPRVARDDSLPFEQQTATQIETVKTR